MTRFRPVLVLLAMTAAAAGAQGPSGRMVEWPYVGADQAHTKYSSLADINRTNVRELTIAWQWDPAEQPLPEYNARPGGFQATPLMIDDTLYLPTMYSRVVALDAETGAVLHRVPLILNVLGGKTPTGGDDR